MVQRVKALTEALEGSDVSELDLTESGTRIVIRRRLHTTVLAHAHPNGNGSRVAAGAWTHHPAEAAPPPDPGITVNAPLTGVFYAASSPSAPPFVQPGDAVHVGQVVCIIEAMKVFNEIKSEVAGIVTAVVPEPGQLVHKDAVLIRLQSS